MHHYKLPEERGEPMRWRIAVVGKPKLSFAAEGIELYLSRLQRWTRVEFVSVRASIPEAESRELERITQGWYRVLLDERGEQVNSQGLARKLQEWEIHGPTKIALIIGGAEGHSPCLRHQANWTWSLSKLTFQHEIATLLAIEQLYRAYTIARGTPYHRK